MSMRQVSLKRNSAAPFTPITSMTDQGETGCITLSLCWEKFSTAPFTNTPQQHQEIFRAAQQRVILEDMEMAIATDGRNPAQPGLYKTL